MVRRKKLVLSLGVFVLISCFGLVIFSTTLLALWYRLTLNAPAPYKKLPGDVQGISVTTDRTVTITDSKGVSSPSGLIKYPADYTIVLVGDSMTERLGNGDELRSFLNQSYPDKTFEVLNYGYGATNILSVQERLDKQTVHGREYQPVLAIDFDLVIIESFAHNPLSQFPLPEALKKQNEALDKIVASIKKTHPQAQIAFLATIAPNKDNYGKPELDLKPPVRKQWASERESYLQNHLKYAKEHNIPAIDVYHKSLDFWNNGQMIFIDKSDGIHPSPLGILLISDVIAKRITELKLVDQKLAK